MKLYKFRSLADDRDCKNIKTILETGKFWCSRFSELNDPMEGSFTVSNAKVVDLIYNEKQKYKICSFSSFKAFENPSMWGYYANGFKGVAIEINVDEESIKKIKYSRDITWIKKISDEKKVEKILTTKLLPWKRECEYRFLKKDGKNEHKIGEITAIYFGDPYERARNKPMIYRNNKNLEAYDNRKDELMKSIPEGIGCYLVAIDGYRVIEKTCLTRTQNKPNH